jgi:hypothetical protein
MRVKCKSGITGERSRLQSRYDSFEEFTAYAEMYSLHTRLGYRSIRGCWESNPMIESSVIPSDFRRVFERIAPIACSGVT